MLLYDPETGIMRDINTENGFCGAYCFHDPITESVYNFFNNVYNSTSDFREWAKKIINNFSQGVNWFMGPFYNIRSSYQWKGWEVVYNRIRYGYLIVGGAAGIYYSWNKVFTFEGFITFGFALDSLWTGLNEYSAHLDEVGSIDYKPF
ncbi:hypothetical protein [Methanobacterium alcaliphilum]|uniref:hypothetical protein n=1 Tax=Methanobacterium alcaliphilum TaxID=392018 RepID=UPI00200A4A3F|nr:hypothetical protein [Methanobacterium alcaliphilum]MCK9151840.1 hypothetical protein [Methanobacterium alcaliphilum]